VTVRGSGRGLIYRDPSDKERFLEVLGECVERRRWRLLAYCLMRNHFHLLVQTPEPNLAAGMQQLNGVYAQWFNRQHARVGHLFQGRYGAKLV
jgi:REP element-mobilizing transposase RayT